MYIKIDIKKNQVFLPIIERPASPFFTASFSDTAEHTVDSFLKAVRLKHIEDAQVYISKNYQDRIDLDELTDLLVQGRGVSVRHVLGSNYRAEVPKGCVSKAFLVTDGAKSSLFNVNMLKEPNSFGKWKIYSIEREEAPKVGVRVMV